MRRRGQAGPLCVRRVTDGSGPSSVDRSWFLAVWVPESESGAERSKSPNELPRASDASNPFCAVHAVMKTRDVRFAEPREQLALWKSWSRYLEGRPYGER